ncbi:DUF4815 domain-containing protein [Salmonella enterica subsp. enterica serovar Saintpaul]|nr:DUF4815 domain-containing protein [Salmonella enterica subsp. enterica serovar Saintpaul]
MPTSIDQISQKDGYYDTFDPAKNYDKCVFLAGRILQARELNEVQSGGQFQLKQIADALFKDGDIVRDCRANLDRWEKPAAYTMLHLEDGALYVQGQVRGIQGADLNVPTTGTVVVGVWLIQDVVTDADDPNLVDPASGTRAFNEAGAYRLRHVTKWGLSTEVYTEVDVFFPVYYIDEGQLRAKEPPPNLDAVTQSIARYDVDSNGSNYIINGLRVTRLDDEIVKVNGQDITHQVYSIDAGRARVNGFGVSQNYSYRLSFDPEHDVFRLDQEDRTVGKADTTTGKQRVNTRYKPIAQIEEVTAIVKRTVTRQKTGAHKEVLPSSLGSLQDVLAIKVGSNTLVKGTDWSYTRDDNAINWLLPATEPASGTSYDVDYLIKEKQTPTDVDDTGFNLTGVYEYGDQTINVWVTYSFFLPRFDCITVDENGKFGWIKGIASDTNPASPSIPSNVLSLATVNQTWFKENGGKRTTSTISNNGVRMVSMSSLEAMNSRMDGLTDMVARLNLISDINIRDASRKDGLFVDPFLDDSQRDPNLTTQQELAITGGCLQLPIVGDPQFPLLANGIQPITKVESCDYDDEIILANTAITRDMPVNPYNAFGVFPGIATLTPQVDRWVETNTTWTGPETRYFTIYEYAPWTLGNVHGTTQTTGQTVTNELAGSSTSDLEYLRSITVNFRVEGFLSQEALDSVTFDGVPITVTNP